MIFPWDFLPLIKVLLRHSIATTLDCMFHDNAKRIVIALCTPGIRKPTRCQDGVPVSKMFCEYLYS